MLEKALLRIQANSSSVMKVAKQETPAILEEKADLFTNNGLL
jgi:hypothetical protein